MKSANTEYDSFDGFMLAVRRATEQPQSDGAKRFRQYLAVGSDEHGGYASPLGGFLMPTGHSGQLLKRAWDFSKLAGRATKVPMSGAGMNFPCWRENTRVDGSRLGGIVSTWSREAMEIPASRMKTEQLSVSTAPSLKILLWATRELVDRADPPLDGVFLDAAAEETAVQLDTAILRGTGTGMPSGFLDDTGTIVVSKKSGQAADSILKENVVNMLTRLWAYSDEAAVFFCSRSAQAELINGDAASLLRFSEGDDGKVHMTLAGKPLIVIEQASAVGDKGDLVLADMSQYALGIERELEMTTSIHVRFVNHEQAYRFWLPCDGRQIWRTPVTPMFDPLSQSPFIVLEDRA